MANPSSEFTLHALGAESGAGSGTGVDLRSDEVERTAAYVRLRVTGATVPFPLTLETSADNSTGWRPVGQMFGGGSPVAEVLAVDDCDRYLRVGWPAGTTGTFSATAVGHQLLARRDDLYAKLDREICRETDEKEPGTVARALIEATDVAVGPLGAFRDIDCMIRLFGIAAGPLGEVELTLPYEQVPKSVVGAVASIAAKFVLLRHGFVGGGVDELVVAADAEARAWLLGVGNKATAAGVPTGVPVPQQWTIPMFRR